MKKLFFVLAFALGTHVAFSQELGIRFGDVTGGNDVALDAIFKTGKFNRIHADVSFGNGVGVEVLWDFLYKPFSIEGEGFNWYVGAGPSIRIDDPFFLGVSGEIGIEYQFKFPMVIGIDWRPTFWLIETTDFHAGGFGANIRYVFGKNK